MPRLLTENEFLVMYFTGEKRALVFRVLAIQNRGYEKFCYGPLPLRSDSTVYGLDGGATSVPADGVLPGRSYTSDLTFPLSGAYDPNDMWFLPEELGDRIFHVIQRVTPSFIKIAVNIPWGVNQIRFQKDKVVGGVTKDFGFSRGELETIHVPKVKYGFVYANDTNMSVYTYVEFTYGEYIIEIPRDPELIFAVLTKKVPAYWYTVPLISMPDDVRSALEKVYGVVGFPLYGLHQRAEAIETYSELINQLKR